MAQPASLSQLNINRIEALLQAGEWFVEDEERLTPTQEERLRFWDAVVQHWDDRFKASRLLLELVVEPGPEHVR